MKLSKLLILGMLGLALVGAITGWVHQYYETNHVQALWGSEALALIAYAPQVMMISQDQNAPLKTTEEVETSRAPGMSNIRYMLGRDFSYETFAPAPASDEQFPWGLEFRDEAKRARLDFSPDCRYVTLNGNKTATLRAPAAAELLLFFKPHSLANHQTK